MEKPTNEELANWFVESGSWRKVQGADGFEYAREGNEYLYIWVMAHVDLDLEQHYLLDVRTNEARAEGDWEHRIFLYVFVDGWSGDTDCKVVGEQVSFNADIDVHQKRLHDGLHEFVDTVTNTHFRNRGEV